MSRYVTSVIVTAILTFPALAQPVNLTEKVAVGDVAKYSLELELKGNLLVVQEGMKQPIRLEARAKHGFTERVLTVSDGLARTSARHYSEAQATALVAGEKAVRSLSADRRLVVARRNPDGLLCFAPAGPMTRDDLDLVTEHFNPQCLAGLLPGKVVNVGDTWTVSDNAAQAACLFEGVIKNGLIGKLTAVKDGAVTFAIEGKAEGIEDGAKVTLIVGATGQYDTTSGRITSLTWKQKDEREQGVVNPASEVEVTVSLHREQPMKAGAELSDEAVSKIPIAEIATNLMSLSHVDPKGRYRFNYSREWYVTGQSDSHLILRLIENGEFVAQATVAVWRTAEAGKHATVEEFTKAVSEVPGWKPGKTLAEGELKAREGWWLYRTIVEGKADDAAVVQSFYLLAGPKGDQIVVTLMLKPEKLKVIADRDLELLRSIEFGK